MVLDPLERMIEKVKMISKNPLIATSEEVHEAGIMSFFDHEEKRRRIMTMIRLSTSSSRRPCWNVP